MNNSSHHLHKDVLRIYNYKGIKICNNVIANAALNLSRVEFDKSLRKAEEIKLFEGNLVFHVLSPEPSKFYRNSPKLRQSILEALF